VAGFTSIVHLWSSVPKFLLTASAPHAAAWALPYSTTAGSHLGPEKLSRIADIRVLHPKAMLRSPG
jgi:hypothetical protein